MSLILQLDSQGQPNKWVSWQDAAIYYAKEIITWTAGESEFIIRGGRNKVTGEQTIIKLSSIICIKGDNRQRKKPRPPLLANKQLFLRDKHLCAYCGKVFSAYKLSRDHILPKSRGGDDTWMNVVTSCKICNQKKSNMTLEESGMELLYLPYIPTKAEHLILANRNVLFDQMQFLLPFIPETSRIKKQLIKSNNSSTNILY